MGKRELSAHQRNVLQWIADGCPETDWGERTFKQSARMLAGHNLVKIRGHGKAWEATATERGLRVLAGDEPLVVEGKSKSPEGKSRRSSATRNPTKPIDRSETATSRQSRTSEQVKNQVDELYQRLLEAEFHIVTGLPLEGDSASDWEYIVERLRSLPVVKEEDWRVSFRTHLASYWNRNDIKTLDVALIPRDVWLTTSPEEVAAKERVGRYHPAVAEVMAYSTNLSGALKPRARRLLHSLFSEADARGFTHGSASASFVSARDRGSLGSQGTGYGFSDSFQNYFIAANEQCDRVERPPTREELRRHEDELRWYPNAKLKTFYDRPYNGKILITIQGRQAKDTKRKTAEQRLPEIFATLSLEQTWKRYDREMKRRAEELWQKKLAIAEVRADERIKNQSYHDSLRDRANAWDQYKRNEAYIDDLRGRLKRSEDKNGSAKEWLAWCEEHLEEQNPMRNMGLPTVEQPSHVDRQKIVENIARKMRDDPRT